MVGGGERESEGAGKTRGSDWFLGFYVPFPYSNDSGRNTSWGVSLARPGYFRQTPRSRKEHFALLSEDPIRPGLC